MRDRYDPYIQYTGMSFCNVRVNESVLPGRRITDNMIYHLCASGVFEALEIGNGFDHPTTMNQAQMLRYVHEKDRLEIMRLKAELEIARKR